MPQFVPFRGTRYTAAAGPLSELIAPPYDVISPGQRRALEARNPRNSVLLELAEGGDERYGRVAALLATWIEEGALARDDEPMLYVYEQEFVEAGATYRRRALIAAVEAQPWEEGAVKPHEFTMSGPKADRLKLLQATGMQFSPVFMIARDRAGQLAGFIERTMASRSPDATATSIDGDQHRLWAVVAGTFEMRQLAPLLAESFYIADGHHRYETAVNYRDWRLAQGDLPAGHPARFAMTAVVSAADPGLVIRPIHRMVPRPAPANWRQLLSATFAIEESATPAEADAFEALLGGGAIVALGLEPGKAHVLRRKPGVSLPGAIPPGRSEAWVAIPPNVLRYGVLDRSGAFRTTTCARAWSNTRTTPRRVIEFMAAHPGSAAFMLEPVGIDSVMTLADQGERMPQKSTFFHPKLGTGLVFHPLDE